MPTFKAGKFGRLKVGGAAVAGLTKWTAHLRRERLDTTHFESAVSSSGNNIFSEGLTGVLDSTFSVEGIVDTSAPDTFFPDGPLECDFLYTKDPEFGYKSIGCDVLAFTPGVPVKDRQTFSAELQSSGTVPYSA